LRAALNTLGDGFVEAIDDNTLMTIAASKCVLPHGKIHGEAIAVPVLEAPGQNRIAASGGRTSTALLFFIGDAYLNEMGVTNLLAADGRDNHRQGDGGPRMCRTI